MKHSVNIAIPNTPTQWFAIIVSPFLLRRYVFTHSQTTSIANNNNKIYNMVHALDYSMIAHISAKNMNNVATFE